MNSRLIITYLVLVAFLGLVAFAYINRSTDTNYVAMQDKDFENRVKSIITNNPELILETVMRFQEKEAESEKKKAQDNIKTTYKKILQDKTLSRIGSGKTKVIEFYDYMCGYCKNMAALKKKYSEKGVEFILIDTPVLGGNSDHLARAAVVIQFLAPDKFENTHFKLLENKNMKPKALIQKLLKDYDIDPKKFKEMLKSKKVSQQLEKGRRYASDAGIYATPAYIINGELYIGALPESQFKEIIN